jgi:hypothetical protein
MNSELTPYELYHSLFSDEEYLDWLEGDDD